MKPSLIDDRDWDATNFFGDKSYPKTLDMRSKLPPIRNQGEQGSCAAQSAACMKEFQERLDNNITEHFSPQFVYDNRKNQKYPGMTCRDVMNILSKKGCPLEQDYPYNYISNPADIDPQIFEAAKKFKIKSYARVHDVDDLKKSLANNGPCLISFPVYNYKSMIWRPKYKTQAMRGGHAMTIVGYNKDSFIVRNSWGVEWGDMGYTYYPFTDWGMHFDCWTTVDEKYKVQEIIDELDTSDDVNDETDQTDVNDETDQTDVNDENSHTSLLDCIKSIFKMFK